MEKQQRRELKASFFQTETSNTQAQRNYFFNQERLCQYIPVSTEDTGTPTSSLDDIKRIINKCLWARLMAVRIRPVLSALLPLLNVDKNGTFYVAIDWVSSGLSPLGWVLHGLRLLINVIGLLQQALLIAEMNEGNEQTWHERVGVYIQSQGHAIGNDLIWILAAIAPVNLLFTSIFLIVDVLWLSGRAWLKTQRLNESRDAIDSMTDNPLFRSLTKKIAGEQQVFFLNLANLLSTSALAMIKNFVLPTFFPILALNPLLLLMLSVLSLIITITSHWLEQAWIRPHLGDATTNTEPTTILPSLRDLHSSNEDDLDQPMNLTYAR